MSDAIIPLPEARSISKELAVSNLIPTALKKKPEDILAIILTGQEIGFGPMQSLRAFHIINGAVTMKAETMAALVRASPVCEYMILVKSTDQVATYETRRKGDPHATVLSYTVEEAKRAGLTGNPNWSKHPAAMLRARAVSSLCKAVYSDLLLGVYEESDTVDEPLTGLKAQIRAEVIDVSPMYQGEPHPPPTAPAGPELTPTPEESPNETE